MTLVNVQLPFFFGVDDYHDGEYFGRILSQMCPQLECIESHYDENSREYMFEVRLKDDIGN